MNKSVPGVDTVGKGGLSSQGQKGNQVEVSVAWSTLSRQVHCQQDKSPDVGLSIILIDDHEVEMGVDIVARDTWAS